MKWVTLSWYRSSNRTPKRYFYSMPNVSDLSPDELILSALELPEAAVELERRYGTTRAILVVDFNAMRARTDAFGIVYALATIRAAFDAYRPRGGYSVSYDRDVRGMEDEEVKRREVIDGFSPEHWKILYLVSRYSQPAELPEELFGCVRIEHIVMKDAHKLDLSGASSPP